MRFKYIIGDSYDPYYNLAFEEALVQSFRDNSVLIYLWQNNHTIVVGKNQDIYSECKVNEFKKVGGRIARRKSGGGAVYHDLGNVNFSIITSSDIQDAYSYYKLLKQVLEKFDLNISFNGRNDLMVDGFKISGNAAYITPDGIVCQHGTVLIDTDIKTMSDYLTPDKEKLERNSVSSVKSRVLNLSDICPSLSIEVFCREFIRTFDMEPLTQTVCKEKLIELRKQYASEDWIVRGIR